MKKWVGIVITLVSFLCPISALEHAEISLQAQQDAAFDGEAYHAFGVGLLAFSVCFAASPLGGLGVILLCYSVESSIPQARLAAATEKYPDATDLLIYTSQYRETLTPIQRRKNGGAALLGTGVGCATILVVMAILFGSMGG